MPEPVHHNRRPPQMPGEYSWAPRLRSWPWSYASHWYGQERRVVLDGDGRILASGVMHECGPMLAAGPALLAALFRVAGLTKAGSPAHEIAVRAIEEHVEREGLMLNAPAAWEFPRPRMLHIAGVAT